MHGKKRSLIAALALTASLALAADRLVVVPAQGAEQKMATTPPPAIVLDNQDAEGILGKEVRSTTDQYIGRLINVIVDQSGQARAAVIDFGGFMGVGNRKIAVDWTTLHFDPTKDPKHRIMLELTQDQVRAAPEFKEGKPVVVMGGLAALPSSDGSVSLE